MQKISLLLTGSQTKKGFTLIELLVTMTIISILFTFGSINLFYVQNKTYLDSNVTTLISDIKRQQLKTMFGETEGSAGTYNYGVHFETNSYTLFKGIAYAPGEASNFVVTLEGQVVFNNTSVPSSQIVFTKGSGEFNGFTPGSNTITLQEAGGIQKTLTINRYGVITSVN